MKQQPPSWRTEGQISPRWHSRRRPAAIAFLVARTFTIMLTVAVGSVMLSALVGIFASYHIDSEPASTMVLVMTGCSWWHWW